MATKDDLEEILQRIRDLISTTARMVDLSVDSREELRRLGERITALEQPVKRLVEHLEAKDKALALIEAEKQAGKSAVWTLLSNPAITAAIAAIVGALLSYLGIAVGGANAQP